MSYPDLQHEVAERVRPPAFEDVLARAADARRRRRTTVGAGLAAGVVVAGLAFTVGDPAAERSGEPADAPRSWDGTSEVAPDLPDDVRSVLEAEDVHLWSVSGSEGATAVVWRSCEPAPCRFAVTSRAGDEAAGTTVDEPTDLTAVPGGWVLVNRVRWSRLTPDGDEQMIWGARRGEPGVMAGDAAVAAPHGWVLLRGDRMQPMPLPPQGHVTGAYVTPSGRLVVATEDGADVRVWWSDDGTGWGTTTTRSTRPVSTALLAGHGEAVTLVLLGDDPDGSIPVVDVRTTAHAGAPFVAVEGLDLEGEDRLRDLNGLAVSEEGTTFLTTETHGLTRATVEGSATVMGSSHPTSVFADGDRVCVVVEGGRVDHLTCSTDDGATWQSQPLPGFS